MAQRHQVWLAGLTWTPDQVDGISHLQEMGCQVISAPMQRHSPLAHVPGLLRFALAGIPPELKFMYSPALAGKIRILCQEQPLDVVHVEQSRMAIYREALPAGQPPRQYLGFQNIAFDQYHRIFQIMRGDPPGKFRVGLHSLWMRWWEPKYAAHFDGCIVVSQEDQALLSKANPHLKFALIPNGVDLQRNARLPAPATQDHLLFVGSMGYPPCSDAAIYFCTQVLPLLHQKHPGLQLWVVGSEPPPELCALDGPYIHVTGRVPDIQPYYQRSRVVVVPLRAGGGTRLKILESMALGRPVVSTAIGCEGLQVTDGENILVADEPQAMADRVASLLEDTALYQRLVDNARQLVVDRYDWDRIALQLEQVYQGDLGS
jgi:glycosyltransferase involved in cell wall biosynthesis